MPPPGNDDDQQVEVPSEPSADWGDQINDMLGIRRDTRHRKKCKPCTKCKCCARKGYKKCQCWKKGGCKNKASRGKISGQGAYGAHRKFVGTPVSQQLFSNNSRPRRHLVWDEDTRSLREDTKKTSQYQKDSDWLNERKRRRGWLGGLHDTFFPYHGHNADDHRFRYEPAKGRSSNQWDAPESTFWKDRADQIKNWITPSKKTVPTNVTSSAVVGRPRLNVEGNFPRGSQSDDYRQHGGPFGGGGGVFSGIPKDFFSDLKNDEFGHTVGITSKSNTNEIPLGKTLTGGHDPMRRDQRYEKSPDEIAENEYQKYLDLMEEASRENPDYWANRDQELLEALQHDPDVIEDLQDDPKVDHGVRCLQQGGGACRLPTRGNTAAGKAKNKAFHSNFRKLKKYGVCYWDARKRKYVCPKKSGVRTPKKTTSSYLWERNVFRCGRPYDHS